MTSIFSHTLYFRRERGYSATAVLLVELTLQEYSTTVTRFLLLCATEPEASYS
jgi:hypothetical protein